MSDANTARPLTAGGTGGTSQITGWDGLTAKGTDIASNATINLTTATGPRIDITGTTTITAVTLAAGSIRIARATGIFQITASASLVVNKSTSVNYTTAVGDLLIFTADGSVVSVTAIGSGGTAATTSAAGIVELATNAEAVTGTDTGRAATANNLSAVRQRRNRLVNPAMQISQQNGNTSGTTTGYFVADQWAMYRVTSAGTITAQRVQSQTIYKSKDRARITITAADASLAAGEYLTLNQNIEGQEVADFAYGAAGARQSVLRFGFKGPAGTYAISIKNSALNRSYVKTFSPTTANTDEMISLVIPGDESGTWLTDTGIGISLDFVFAAGSTFQGTDAAWQAGNFLGTSGVSNGMGTISQVFEIFDVGLYLDVEDTEVAPPWELPDYDGTFRKCQRYYEKSYSLDVALGTATTTGAVGIRNGGPDGTTTVYFRATKRSTVTARFWTTNGVLGSWDSVGAVIADRAMLVNINGTNSMVVQWSSTVDQLRGHWEASARM